MALLNKKLQINYKYKNLQIVRKNKGVIFQILNPKNHLIQIQNNKKTHRKNNQIIIKKLKALERMKNKNKRMILKNKCTQKRQFIN